MWRLPQTCRGSGQQLPLQAQATVATARAAADARAADTDLPGRTRLADRTARPALRRTVPRDAGPPGTTPLARLDVARLPGVLGGGLGGVVQILIVSVLGVALLAVALRGAPLHSINRALGGRLILRQVRQHATERQRRQQGQEPAAGAGSSRTTGPGYRSVIHPCRPPCPRQRGGRPEGSEAPRTEKRRVSGRVLQVRHRDAGDQEQERADG